MSDDGIRRLHGERGATLILAIAFLVVIGGIGAAVVSSITSSLKDRIVLDQVRNRQYAADGAIEYAIAQVRNLPAPAQTQCGPGNHYTKSLNGVDIRVDCANALTLTLRSILQLNVIFTACVDRSPSVPCTEGTTVERAQVNFQSAGPTQGVTRTWVQSWSVNR